MYSTLTAALFAVTFASAAEPLPATFANLNGLYTIVSGQRDGKPLPPSDFTGSLVRFDGNTILGTDKDKKQFFASTYKIDASTNPAKITMASMNPMTKQMVTTTGLIAVEGGDIVKIVYALPGGKEPTEFRAGELQHFFMLKRMEAK